MTPDIDIGRRSFLGTGTMAIAAAKLGIFRLSTQSGEPGSLKPRTVGSGANPSFGPLKQIDAGVLNVGYAEAGPSDGRAVILLHGWPYDIHSFVEVAPLLAAAGFRVIVPQLRGHGSTRFLSSATFRNAQQSVVALGQAPTGAFRRGDDYHSWRVSTDFRDFEMSSDRSHQTRVRQLQPPR